MKAVLMAGLLAASWLLPTPSTAAEPMTVAEFEAYVTGHTLTYAREGVVWGTEQYLPDRHVVWAFEGGECQRGSWFEESDNQVCFTYDGGDSPICWRFFKGAKGVEAKASDDPVGLPLAELGKTDVPINCPGPDVGV